MGYTIGTNKRSMKFNSVNMKVVRMAASNLQPVNGTSHLATDKWLQSTGCLQTFSATKPVDSRPGKRIQNKTFRLPHRQIYHFLNISGDSHRITLLTRPIVLSCSHCYHGYRAKTYSNPKIVAVTQTQTFLLTSIHIPWLKMHLQPLFSLGK